MRAANIVKSKNNHIMYVKIEDLKQAILKPGNEQTLRARLLGMIQPFETFTQQQVDQEQAAKANNTTAAAEEPIKKKKPYDFNPGRGGIIEMLQEMADNLRKGGIDVPPFPTSPFGSFADFMQRRAGHTENSIKLEYEKEEAARFAHSFPPAIEQISADFVQKFKEKFNGLPSPKLFDQIKDDIAGSLRRYRESVNAGNPKGLCLEFQFSPNLGKCDCEACKITPLN